MKTQSNRFSLLEEESENECDHEPEEYLTPERNEKLLTLFYTTCCDRPSGLPMEYMKLIVKGLENPQNIDDIIDYLVQSKYKSLKFAEKMVASYAHDPTTFKQRFSRAKSLWGDEYIDAHHRFENLFIELLNTDADKVITEQNIVQMAKNDMIMNQDIDYCYWYDMPFSSAIIERLGLNP